MRKMQRAFTIWLMCMAGVILLGHTAQAKGKPSITAESAVVMDVQSGTILYEKNKNKKEYPASITKIMTGLLALENSSLSETVTYSRNAVTNLEYKASNIDIKPGEKLSMEDSLYGILLMSANEACNGVAEHIAGSVDNFVDMMNAKAKELGCTGTHFANANGLWMKNHYTTAYDMALIARAAFRNSDFAKITGTKRYNIEKTNKSGKRYLYNHHGMLYPSTFSQYLYKYCVGGKTGYTEKCRYTLVTYAKKDDMTLVAVIMKAPNSPWTAPDANEYTDTTKLLNYCFENYDRYEVEEDATATVNSQYLFNRFSPYYNEETTPLSVEEDASVMLPKGVALEKAKKKIELYDQAKTVTSTKKNIGKITYTYKGKEVGGAEIYYDTKEQATLNDSIDMSAWFDDAVEKANQSPFPWKKLIFVVVLLLMAGGVTFLVLWWMRVHKEQRVRRNHFRRTRRNRRKNERKKFTNRRKKL